MPTAQFQPFLSCGCVYRQSTHDAKRGGRQFSMSENICALVELFDKAFAEGARQTLKTRSEPHDETEIWIETYIGTQPQ